MSKPAANHPWRKKSGPFDCPPDCANRKPGCHSHCEHYQKRCEEWQKKKAAIDRERMINEYSANGMRRAKDTCVKRAKNLNGYKKVRNW